LLRQRPRTIYQWVADRRIPHFKPGRVLFFDRAEIDNWVRQSRREAEHSLMPEGRDAVSIVE
jgi:excisionase family DNA binding protein